MLIDTFVTMKWNSNNKRYYESRGYKFTKMKDSFDVDINDLPKGSNVKVRVKCDYCGNDYLVSWYSYYNLKKKSNNKDCCSNPDCTTKKSKEVLLEKYNTTNIRQIDGVNEKIIKTNTEKYGVENPFQSEEVKAKIVKTNIEKYGVPCALQNAEIKEKAKKTCLEKYGVDNYGKIYSETHTKELSPCWKGGVENHRVERSTIEYRRWREQVFSRDNYTCASCGARNGNGKYIILHAHHINNWKDNEDVRYEIDNGITLCNDCHMRFHSIFGKRNNNEEQLKTFLDKKIC